MGNGERWRFIGLVTFVVAGFLLLSMGGAIVAAPITVPLMWMAACRHRTQTFRVTATVLCALTGAEVVWAATYLTLEDAQPWIWLMPTVTCVAVILLFRRLLAPPHQRLPIP
jgi:hypothetical protein